MLSSKMSAERKTPRPGIVERVAGAVALATGVPLAIWVVSTFVVNLLDGEVLEIPTLLAALPAELPDLGIFSSSLKIWHDEKSREG